MVGIANRIYSCLPVALQNFACSWRGRQVLRHRYGGGFRDILAWLKESQWWTRDRLREYQDQQLRDLMRHAYQTVPYYGRLMRKRGLAPADFQTVTDLRKLPVLTKDKIRKTGKEMISTAVDPKQVVQDHTSGTTGAGLKFPMTRKALRFQWAVWWRHRSRFGIELCQPHANFSGQMVVPLESRSPPFWRENRPLNQTYVSLYHMTPENMPAYVEMLESRKFKYFAGYPSGIYLVADYLRSVSHKLTQSPEIIITGAESLLPFQVQAFKEWIGAPVTEQYGQIEGCANLSKCEHGNFHTDMEFAIVEPIEIQRGPEGRLCRIVGTSLHNYAMPFIRYDTGDIATFCDEACPCRRHAPIATYIDGRVESYIVTPEGRRIGRMDHCFKDMVNVREAQIVQNAVDAVEIRIVRAEGYGDDDEKQLLGELRSRLGQSIRVDIEYVANIPRTKTGKFRAVVSHLDSGDAPDVKDMDVFMASSGTVHLD